MDTENTLQPEHATNTTVQVGDSDTDTDAQASEPLPFSDPATKYTISMPNTFKLLKLPG